MSNQSDKNELKIILIGNVFVGKTCIIHYYKTGKFLENIPSSQGTSFTKVKMDLENNKYTLHFWDTAGQEKYNSLTKTFIKNSQIVVLVYSIVDRESFEKLDTWLNLVKDEIGNDGYILGVAANKNDLYSQAAVSDKEGQSYATKVGAIFEKTSVKDKSGIKELIEKLVKKYIEVYKDTKKQDFTQLNNNQAPTKKGCCK